MRRGWGFATVDFRECKVINKNCDARKRPNEPKIIASSYGCLSPLARILHRLSTKNIQENTHIHSISCYKEVRKYCAEIWLIMEFCPRFQRIS